MEMIDEPSGSNGKPSYAPLRANQKAGSNDFVRKLFKILEGAEYNDIIRWTEDGDSFVVLNTNEFTTKILPQHFKHSNFSSFVRQLNKYDFHKIKRTNEEKQNSQYGEHSWEFKHPFFKIHDEDQLDNIKRKSAVQKKIMLDDNTVLVKQGGDNAGGLDSTADLIFNTAVSKSKFNQLKRKVETIEEEVNYLKNENYELKLGYQKSQSRYNTLLDNLISTKEFNNTLLTNFNVLVNSLSSQGLDIPPNLTFNATMPNTHTIKNTQSPQMSSAVPTLSVRKPSTMDSNPASTTPNMILDHPILRPGFHVLLVEDDSICIQLCSKFLMKYGCTVEVVTDGLSAISTLEKFRYDLVLMDIVMPNLDGATATSIVRSFDNQTPIIAMTGNIEDQDLVTYLQHGMNDILAKPFTKDDLHSMLIRYLRNRVPLSEQRAGSSSKDQHSPSLPQESEVSDLIREEPQIKKQRV
ncbi:KLTH0D17182p [Lachancea thermotolerans CBS 6340]|uniref:Transcription factor n=1 Tax=Lachancea thermotolerans (strain ATCC 56472 / CBS 6340 / NRRL Y-8284) TaxID=559295 RepID=C5DFR0_LACTC|nr:KLTH0D17182p [Lachancea thermotolerans CBS 6340]CAR23015.1 KLTH0D17182p [Lachancea thermotolerans CBS 6340]